VVCDSAAHYPILIIHVITASIALVTVPLQLWSARHYNGMHRMIGRIALFAGVFPGGVTAVILAMMHTYGLASQSGFATSALLWTIFAILGYRAVRQGRYADHRAWMIRSFAVIMGTVMLRIQLVLLINVMPFMYPAYQDDFGALYTDAFHTIAWLSWFPNLLIAEWYLRRTAPTPEITSVTSSTPDPQPSTSAS
jgi:uncharacterized membrane protein YozB (DUF420 family)